MIKTDVKIKTVDGEVSAILHGQVVVEGNTYTIIESGKGGYINGLYCRYILMPVSAIIRSVNNPLEEVEDEVNVEESKTKRKPEPNKE